MHWKTLAALALAFAPASSYAANKQVPGTAPHTRPATSKSSVMFDMVSQFNHEAYRIKVFLPKGPAPAHGFPTLYVLDGDLLFATFAGAMRNQSQAKEIEPSVIVGIEGGPGKKGADRTYDFTSTDLTAHEKQIVVDLGPNPIFGGYESFFRFIQEEVKPQVAQLASIDQHRSALLGWSLGGLAVTHTMLVHPDAFHDYVALSPSLWRSNRMAFSEIPVFSRAVVERNIHVNLFMGVGSLEEELSNGMKTWDIDQDKLAEEIKYARMVGNAKDFAADIGPFLTQHRDAFAFTVFNGDTHNTVPWNAVNPILKFLYTPTSVPHQ